MAPSAFAGGAIILIQAGPAGAADRDPASVRWENVEFGVWSGWRRMV